MGNSSSKQQDEEASNIISGRKLSSARGIVGISDNPKDSAVIEMPHFEYTPTPVPENQIYGPGWIPYPEPIGVEILLPNTGQGFAMSSFKEPNGEILVIASIFHPLDPEQDTTWSFYIFKARMGNYPIIRQIKYVVKEFLPVANRIVFYKNFRETFTLDLKQTLNTKNGDIQRALAGLARAFPGRVNAVLQKPVPPPELNLDTMGSSALDTPHMGIDDKEGSQAWAKASREREECLRPKPVTTQVVLPSCPIGTESIRSQFDEPAKETSRIGTSFLDTASKNDTSLSYRNLGSFLSNSVY